MLKTIILAFVVKNSHPKRTCQVFHPLSTRAFYTVYTFPVFVSIVAESQCRRERVCMCQHFPGGAAESDHPKFPPEGCCEASRAHVAGQQPGCQGNSHRGSEVSQYGGVMWTATALICGCLN